MDDPTAWIMSSDGTYMQGVAAARPGVITCQDRFLAGDDEDESAVITA